MAIPEAQLETWSHQGSITNSANTGNSIKNAIDNYQGFPDGIKYNVYLQGSYKNSTNIYGDSDVDVVVELKSSFYNNLTEEQKALLRLTNATYGYFDFRNDVEICLREYYGLENVEIGNKVFKIKPNSNRLPADVLVCSEYRLYYGNLHADRYYAGIAFYTRNPQQRIINFPKQHSDNATVKHQSTNQRFKPMVRIFKNMRNHLVSHEGFSKSTAPSYFIECLLANIPNDQFVSSNQSTFINCFNFLNNNAMDNFMCLNGIRPLWGDTTENWNKADARNFLDQLAQLWNNW